MDVAEDSREDFVHKFTFDTKESRDFDPVHHKTWKIRNNNLPLSLNDASRPGSIWSKSSANLKEFSGVVRVQLFAPEDVNGVEGTSTSSFGIFVSRNTGWVRGAGEISGTTQHFSGIAILIDSPSLALARGSNSREQSMVEVKVLNNNLGKLSLAEMQMEMKSRRSHCTVPVKRIPTAKLLGHWDLNKGANAPEKARKNKQPAAFEAIVKLMFANNNLYVMRPVSGGLTWENCLLMHVKKQRGDDLILSRAHIGFSASSGPWRWQLRSAQFHPRWDHMEPGEIKRKHQELAKLEHRERSKLHEWLIETKLLRLERKIKGMVETRLKAVEQSFSTSLQSRLQRMEEISGLQDKMQTQLESSLQQTQKRFSKTFDEQIELRINTLETKLKRLARMRTLLLVRKSDEILRKSIGDKKQRTKFGRQGGDGIKFAADIKEIALKLVTEQQHKSRTRIQKHIGDWANKTSHKLERTLMVHRTLQGKYLRSLHGSALVAILVGVLLVSLYCIAAIQVASDSKERKLL